MSKDEYSVVVEMDDDTPPPVREELEFQDFSSGSEVGGKIVQDNKQTTTDRTGFNDTEFYDPHRTIRTEAQGGTYPLWSIDYYAQYFDVDTAQVIERAYKSLYPKDDFVNVVGSNPDLYGPFWITTTVIFLLFVTSSIAGSIAAYMSNEDNYTYDFKILSFGVAALYSYTFGVSLLLWVTLKYLGCKPSFLDIIDLYGYGLTIWIPISIVCIVPRETLRWSMVAIGFIISGFFMLKNLYPVILRADTKSTRILLIVVLGIHAAFALLLKFEFYSYEIKGVKNT